LADTFCGGGSIPFEAARLGCDVFASDLNPIACMLTWGAFHIVGADAKTRAAIAKAQEEVAAAVDAEINRLGIEHDSEGNRAKAYLYCLEARCPETGWMVPLSGSWLVSANRRCVAVPEPDPGHKRFHIRLKEGATDAEIERARAGTVRDGQMVYELDGQEHRTPIKTLRGDRRVGDETVNMLRRWEKSDFKPRPDDTFQERIYCVQWARKGNPRDTFFREVGPDDLAREAKVEAIVANNLASWQESGLVPDMAIEPGYNTDQPIRERGWTYWHHLFTARHLLILSAIRQQVQIQPPPGGPALCVIFGNVLDKTSRRGRWRVGLARPGEGGPKEYVDQTFYDQALSTHYNYAARLFLGLSPVLLQLPAQAATVGPTRVMTATAADLDYAPDLVVTDPP
jgi:adenine-specific DNA methylase